MPCITVYFHTGGEREAGLPTLEEDAITQAFGKLLCFSCCSFGRCFTALWCVSGVLLTDFPLTIPCRLLFFALFRSVFSFTTCSWYRTIDINIIPYIAEKLRYRYTVTIGDGSAEVCGTTAVRGHYFENGNIQLQTSKQVPTKTLPFTVSTTQPPKMAAFFW